MAVYIEAYLKENRSKWRPSTHDRNARVLRGYMLRHFGNRTVDSIAVGANEAYLTERPQMKGPERGFVLKNAQPRDIPLTDRCLTLLVRRRQQSKTGLVFSAPADLSRSFRRIARAAGTKDASFHTLRHTFASKLVQQGVAIFTVKELLGHHSVTLTEKHYAALAPKTVEDAIAKLSYDEPAAQNVVTLPQKDRTTA